VQQELPLLTDLTTTMLQDYLNDEVKCQWSMSRPLLALITCICPAAYQEWKLRLLNKQPTVERRELLEKAFTQLMDGIVAGEASSKNKDAFTQQLSGFRRDVETISKGEVPLERADRGEDLLDGDYADNQIMTD